MEIPWKILADSDISKTDLLVYATAAQLWHTTKRDIALFSGLTSDVVQVSLNRLVAAGYLCIQQGVYRTGRIVSQKPDRVVKRSKSDEGKASTVSMRNALKACASAEAGGFWTPLALLGLFSNLYKSTVGLPYHTSSLATDLHVLTLLDAEHGELALWCVRALFGPDLKWTLTKRVDSLGRQAFIEKHVLPAAIRMRDADQRRPEWKTSAAALPDYLTNDDL